MEENPVKESSIVKERGSQLFATDEEKAGAKVHVHNSVSDCAFTDWLVLVGLEKFEEALVGDMGVSPADWRVSIKEIDLEKCRTIGMTILQVRLAS
jgi:hypothetical protein